MIVNILSPKKTVPVVYRFFLILRWVEKRICSRHIPYKKFVEPQNFAAPVPDGPCWDLIKKIKNASLRGTAVAHHKTCPLMFYGSRIPFKILEHE